MCLHCVRFGASQNKKNDSFGAKEYEQYYLKTKKRMVKKRRIEKDKKKKEKDKEEVKTKKDFG